MSGNFAEHSTEDIRREVRNCQEHIKRAKCRMFPQGTHEKVGIEEVSSTLVEEGRHLQDVHHRRSRDRNARPVPIGARKAVPSFHRKQGKEANRLTEDRDLTGESLIFLKQYSDKTIERFREKGNIRDEA